MAFPAIAASLVTFVTTATTAPVVQLPTPPVTAGNLLIMLIRVGVGGAISFTGWTALINAAPDASTDQVGILYRFADGTEGTSITGTSGNGKFAAIVWEISGASHPSTQAPQLSTVAIGTTSLVPNPTAVTPTGGAKDYLFGTLVSSDGETAFSSYPATHTLGQQNTDTAGGGATTTNVRAAGAWQQANAASNDPGNTTYTAGSGAPSGWAAYAIAIHPALVPTITDVEGTEAFQDLQTGVTITGTNFEAAQGLGRVELANSATYASATKVAQTVTSWGATSIDFTSSIGGLTPGALFLFVTNRSGMTSTGMAVTVTAPRRAQISWIAFEVPEAVGGEPSGAVSETATGTDSPSATLTASASRAESATATDSPTGTLSASASLVESATATDTPSMLPQAPTLASHAVSSGSAADPTQWTGIVGAWAPFLGLQTPTLQDISNAGHPATLVGLDAGDWSTGTRAGYRVDGVLTFDGSTSYLDWTSTTLFDFANADFTVVQWFKMTPTALSQYLMNKRGSGGWHVRMNATTGAIESRIIDSTNITTTGQTSAGAYGDNAWHMVAVAFHTDTVTAGSNTVTLYVDGVLDQTTPMTGGGPYAVSTVSPKLGVVADLSLPIGFAGQADDIRVYNRILTAPEILDLFTDPYGFYTLSGLLSSRQETATATDTTSSTLTASATRTETAAASDIISANIIVLGGDSWAPDGWAPDGWMPTVDVGLSASLTEAASATESITVTLSASASLAESGTATETIQGSTGILASRTEQASAVDTSSSSLTANASLTESAAASDASTSTALITRGESAIATDTPAATMSASASLAESGTATDTSQGSTGIPLTRNESAVATDTPSATMSAAATLAESATATDSPQGVTGILANLTESAAAADTPTALLSASMSLSESAAASEAVTSTALVSRAESSTATDTPTALMTASASLIESGTAVDTSQGTTGIPLTRNESAVATDAPSMTLSANASQAEAATATDAPTRTMSATSTLAESATATDSPQGTTGIPLALAESATATDTISRTLQASISRDESATATDAAAATLNASASLVESGTATDTPQGTTGLPASMVEGAIATETISANILAPPQLPPSLVFPSDAEDAALISTLDVLSWEAVAELTALTSETRSFMFETDEDPAALVSTLDILTWEADSDPAELVSIARGGG